MKKTILLLGAFMMLLSISMKAQTLSPTVISSSGGFFSGGNYTVSVTVAEMTMVETFIQTNNMLTQGFQQAFPPYVSIEENNLPAGDVSVYPNPTNGQLNISYNATTDGEYLISIFNIVGQVVYKQSYSNGVGLNTVRIDLSKFMQGVYMLELSFIKLNNKENSSIHKINLVY